MIDYIKNELTYPKSHYVTLGALRGIAILMVVFAHFTKNGAIIFGEPLPINLGRYGVEIFFSISGYLMGNILFCKKQALRDFYVRRFSRIVPALVFYLAVVWTYYLLVGYSPEKIPFISTILMFSNYILAADITSLPRSLAHVWSLCIEEHAYILLSLIAIITRRWWSGDLSKILFVTVLFFAIGFYYSVVLEMNYREAYWRTESRAASIFMAAFIGVKLERHSSLIKNGNWTIGLTSFFIALIFSTSYFPDVIKYTLGSVCTAIAVCTLARAQISLKWLKLPISILCFLGLISYSLYLWQQFFSARFHGWYNIAALFICLLCSIFSFVFIEQKCRHKINNHFTRTK